MSYTAALAAHTRTFACLNCDHGAGANARKIAVPAPSLGDYTPLRADEMICSVIFCALSCSFLSPSASAALRTFSANLISSCWLAGLLSLRTRELLSASWSTLVSMPLNCTLGTSNSARVSASVVIYVVALCCDVSVHGLAVFFGILVEDGWLNTLTKEGESLRDIF